MNRPSRHCLAGILFLAMACVALPVGAQAIQEYEYADNTIYTIRTGLGITTQIELSPDEQILDYSTGFTSGWELTRRDNVFYLKPKNVDVDTNLVIRTATHSYVFELKVVATDWRALEQAKNQGVQYKVLFKYPNETKFVAEADVAPEISTELRSDREYNFNYDYAVRGKKLTWLVPASVYDDGRFTYIRMPDLSKFPSGNFPAVYGRERKNSEDFVVNTTVENNIIVVHGIYPFLVIRHGKNVIGVRRNQAQ
ncbi:TrbG/VirB9 family P-type conjugative transfer protein [Luteimonas panaciterrae]|uniref:TrbG/VirB9 family P-type conjugative transfer protein n=1 Tax=Luteimonas panaciterrae TaxID=363885 RepID=UPI001CF9C36C|nr:TrbG/VirB9 family P-type conjugative transfer protein [Luteimonas panaciterrae]